MSKNSIIEKVKSVKTSQLGYLSREDKIDLAIAYAREEVGLTQIVKAVWPNLKGTGTSRAYCAICLGLKEAVKLGKIKIVS